MHSLHGELCCCVGPVIDFKLKRKVFKCEKFLIQWIRPLFICRRDIFLPSVYDGLVVIRPQCNFRDGTVVTNIMLVFDRYFDKLPFHDSYFFGLLHLISVHYLSIYQDICKQVLPRIVGSSIDPYLDLALSTQFQISSNTLTSDSQINWFSSCCIFSYPLAHPNHLVLSSFLSSLVYAFNQISFCLDIAVNQDIAWCFYIAYLYVSLLELNNWILSVSIILASRMKFVHFHVVCSELIQLLALIFYSTDSFYSLIKPIHQIHR